MLQHYYYKVEDESWKSKLFDFRTRRISNCIRIIDKVISGVDFHHKHKF